MFKTANNDSISRPNSRPKLPFPGNGNGKFKMPREGKGREIWGLYSRESRETGIPAHPCPKFTTKSACTQNFSRSSEYFSGVPNSYLTSINWKINSKKSGLVARKLYFLEEKKHKTSIILGCLDGVWGCLGGVWMMSKGVWQVSGVYGCHINWKQMDKSHYINLFPFLPVTSWSRKGPKWPF